MAAAGTVREALVSASEALAAAGVGTPRLDAELLLEDATGRDRAALAADGAAEVSAAEGRRFGAMIRRRLLREPLAYILGRKGFRYLDLAVDRRALIPRPESELLVELAVELEPATVLDVGTGSGAIAIAIADELPGCRVWGVDPSPEALAVASGNASACGVGDRASFALGEAGALSGSFDLVVANLPYVTAAEYRRLAPEITGFEPERALVGGTDGLDPIRDLLGVIGPGAESELRAGAIGLEIGTEQGAEVAALVTAAGYPEVEVRPDLAGRDRCVVGRSGLA